MSLTSICHSSSLYNLVLNNTVIIIYKLMFLSVNTDCASSPILCYLNVHFGYKTSDASNPILTEKKITGLTFFLSVKMQMDC